MIWSRQPASSAYSPPPITTCSGLPPPPPPCMPIDGGVMTITRTLVMPAVRARRRCATCWAVSFRSLQSVIGRNTVPLLTSPAVPKEPRRAIARRPLPALTSSSTTSST